MKRGSNSTAVTRLVWVARALIWLRYGLRPGKRWQEALQQSFRKSPLVDIQTKIEDADTHELLALLNITSIEIDALMLFPRVTAARREKNYWLIRVELAEVVF